MTNNIGAPQPGETGRTANEGAIYDLGYRPYTGVRLGRGHAFRTLWTSSLKTSFGIGRDARAKSLPFLLLAISVLPALAQTFISGIAGNALNLVTHEQYFARTAWIFALFCAAQSPELVGGDQQYRVLSLYFSRALRRSDYVLAKLAALVSAISIIAVVPHLVLFIGRVLANAEPLTVLRTDAHLLLPIFGSAFMISMLFASIGLLIASVTRRRLLATAAIIGVIMISSGVAAVLVRIGRESMRYAVLASPMLAGEGLAHWFFGDSPQRRSVLGRAALPGEVYGIFAVALIVVAVVLLNLRYRRIDA